MKNSLLFTLQFSALLSVIGCLDKTTQYPVFELDKPFVIAQGTNMQTRDDSLIIFFKGMLGDSRCSQGFHNGHRIDCEFAILHGDFGKMVTLSFGDLQHGGVDMVDLYGYKINLIGVSPEKKEGEEIPQEDFRATFRVSR